MASRLCPKCRIEKPAGPEHFYRRATRADGLDPWCKVCRQEVMHRDGRNAEYQRRDRQKFAEKRREESREWWAKNGAERNRCVKARRQADPERFAHYQRTWRAKSPERARDVWRRWATSEKGRAYFSSPTKRLRNAVSTQVRLAIGGKGGTSIEAALGYSIADLMVHIERQFSQGMSWANYGAWHIDHILPLSGFRIEVLGDPECRAAWALPNLRPLWAAQNVKKGARREHLI